MACITLDSKHLILYLSVVSYATVPSGLSQECLNQCERQVSRPLITDVSGINNSSVFSLVWTDPDCDACSWEYKVVVMNHEMCNITATPRNTSQNNCMLLDLECDLCVVQVVATVVNHVEYQRQSSCLFFNSSMVLNNTHYAEQNSSICVPVKFESCDPTSNVPPIFEYNGEILDFLNDVQSRIMTRNDGGRCFMISNVTENVILLEICILSHQEVCPACDIADGEHILLSRNEVKLTIRDMIMHNTDYGYNQVNTLTCMPGPTNELPTNEEGLSTRDEPTEMTNTTTSNSSSLNLVMNTATCILTIGICLSLQL